MAEIETNKIEDFTQDDPEMSIVDGLPEVGSELPLSQRGSEDEDENEERNILPEGHYKASDYEQLDVSPEIKELFAYISKFQPQNVDMEYKLKCFIPDYIPAVGDIDAFIKVPRPDGESSTLGLTVLDEPNGRQTDATVLDLQLRAAAKHTVARSVVVKTVEKVDTNLKVVDRWIQDISDLHRAKPPPTVHYPKPMPDIDSLMQEWPAEVENVLKLVNLPTAEFDIDLQEYVDIICSILDVPIYQNRVKSLHVLFSLFSAVKNSDHFRRLAEENNFEENENQTETNRLVL